MRNRYFVRYFWGLMSLYLINISIDPPDRKPHYLSEDLSFNEQESIVELLIEKVLGYENAILEQDDDDASNKSNLKKNLTIDIFILPPANNELDKSFLSGLRAKFPEYKLISVKPYIEKYSPPPKI
jgi:hypothetical protein